VIHNFSRNSSQNHIDSLSTQEGYAHAAPLAPLRERDWAEIALLFDRQDSDEIEADVIKKLNTMHPEPCWDEDPYEFLSEFL
jgi:hypothetical protein